MDPPRPTRPATTEARGKPPKLLDEVSARMRRLGRALRTEQAYVGWIRRFILANGKRHPRDMGEREVEAFLTRLTSGFFGGMNLIVNRFTGPGRVGIQSMYLHMGESA